MGKFSRYVPGDPLKFRADTLNSFVDAAEWYSQSRVGGKGGQPLGGVDAPPSLHVSVEASSFTTFGAILTPTGIAANDPATHPLEARRRPCITAAVPGSEDDAIVIVSEPAIHEGTGDPGLARAVVSGVAVCQVLVTDESHRYARPEAGNSEYLVSDDFGPAYLLLPMGGTGGTEPVTTLVVLGMPQPVVVAAPQKYPLGMPCLITDGYGNAIGLAQRWVRADGSVKCETNGTCEGEGCGPGSVPPPDDDNPTDSPDDDPTPPDPPPETFDVFVQVFENFSVDDICSELPTEPSTYSVTVAGSIQGTQIVPSGGTWFTGCPWGVDTTAVLSYGGSEMVMWGAASVGCGGAGSFGFGNTAPVSGAMCAEFSYSFTIGDCGATPPTRTITTEKSIYS